MRPLNFQDDSGNATLEFALIVGLLVAPILNVNQLLNQINERQEVVSSMAQTIARAFALTKSTDSAGLLVQTLASEVHFDSSQVQTEITCLPNPECQPDSTRVRVQITYKGSSAVAGQFMQEEGSMMPLTLGIMGLAIALCLVGTNIESANIYDMRVEQLARFLVQEHFPNRAQFLSKDVSVEAAVLSSEFRMNLTEISQAEITTPEPNTLTARVCAKFDAPIRSLQFGVLAQTCREAKLREIPSA